VEIQYTQGTASEEAIFFHLNQCKEDFIPPLDSKVNIKEYSAKIFNHAVTFEAWHDDIMVGLVAAYFNDLENKTGYITNVSIIRTYRGKGVACNLLNNCLAHARQKCFKSICLEVSALNSRAVLIYEKTGFQVKEDRDTLLIMKYYIVG
jgi:ribosomal protein S18 acetylase RimI-like enzyme